MAIRVRSVLGVILKAIQDYMLSCNNFGLISKDSEYKAYTTLIIAIFIHNEAGLSELHFLCDCLRGYAVLRTVENCIMRPCMFEQCVKCKRLNDVDEARYECIAYVCCCRHTSGWEPASSWRSFRGQSCRKVGNSLRRFVWQRWRGCRLLHARPRVRGNVWRFVACSC